METGQAKWVVIMFVNFVGFVGYEREREREIGLMIEKNRLLLFVVKKRWYRIIYLKKYQFL